MFFKKDKKIKNKMRLTVLKGHNHLFKTNSKLIKYKNGEVKLNDKEIKVLSCQQYVETEKTNSKGKKIVGAAAGSLFGPGGTVVGAMVSGNNKLVKHKFNQIVIEDLDGNIYEALIKPEFLQNEIIQLIFIKGEE